MLKEMKDVKPRRKWIGNSFEIFYIDQLLIVLNQLGRSSSKEGWVPLEFKNINKSVKKNQIKEEQSINQDRLNLIPYSIY